MPTQKLRIRGMRHQDEPALTRTIRELPGVFYAVCNHQDECAEVDFEDDLISMTEICEAVRRLGYVAEPAS